MSRIEFPKDVRRDAAARAKGHCEDCGIRLRSGEFHYDHINPDYFSKDATLENCCVRCVKCHRRKTSEEDRPAIDRAKRIQDREIGIKRGNYRWPKRKTGRARETDNHR